MPTYNRARFVGASIESALRQSYRNIEVVVVDDVSSDETEAAVRAAADSRVRYMRNEANLGVPENLNEAFSRARGEYVILFEDHDLLHPDFVSRCVELLEVHPSISFVATGLTTISEESVPLESYLEAIPRVTDGRWLLRRLLRRTTCPFSVTTVVRKSALAGLDPIFDTKYGWYADQNLWMRLAVRGDFGYIREPLLYMRRRENDHPLSDKVWESRLCLDAIHRDNWKLLHPWAFSPASLFDRLIYDLAKSWAVARHRAQRICAGDAAWTERDRRDAARYLSPLGRAVALAASFVPDRLVRLLARGYITLWRRKHAPAPAVA